MFFFGGGGRLRKGKCNCGRREVVDEGGGAKGRDRLEERKRGNGEKKIIKRWYENKGK